MCREEEKTPQDEKEKQFDGEDFPLGFSAGDKYLFLRNQTSALVSRRELLRCGPNSALTSKIDKSAVDP